MSMTMELVSKPSSDIDTMLEGAKKIVADKGILGTVTRMHKEWVEPWEKSSDKPIFSLEIEDTPTGSVIAVAMEAEAAEQATLSVWQLLDRGTEERPMHVSEDWISKTKPGSITSGAGAGYKTGIRRPWMEGIDERLIAEEIAEAAEEAIDTIVYGAYEDALDMEFRE